MKREREGDGGRGSGEGTVGVERWNQAKDEEKKREKKDEGGGKTEGFYMSIGDQGRMG